MSQRMISVGALVRYLKGRLEGDAFLRNILVEGEISNFSSYRSGHWYFSIKDATAQMRCVMFAHANRQVKFTPKDGDQVLLRCGVSVYEGRGEMQLLVTAMKPIGQGELYLKFEALKKRLQAEGLFSDAYKKEIPRFPTRIGLITGKNTAARADVRNTLSRRWPVAKIVEYPVLVQGSESAGQIISALRKADQDCLDVILLVRGGGSIEDLWSFNDEALARTMHAVQTPIITGIGHEVDFTIADFVADLRAPTPTGAAERCSPDRLAVQKELRQWQKRLQNATIEQLQKKRRVFDGLKTAAVFTQPQRLYSEREFHLQAVKETFTRQLHMSLIVPRRQVNDALMRMRQSLLQHLQEEKAALSFLLPRLQQGIRRQVTIQKNRLSEKAALLDAYSPLKVLTRGYAVALKEKKLLKSIEQVAIGDPITVRLQDGTLRAAVADKKKESLYAEERKDI